MSSMISAASRRSPRLCQFLFIIVAVAAIGRPSAQSTPPRLYAITPVGQLGGSQSAAYDLSEFGTEIAGRAQTASGAYHAFAEGYYGRQDIGTLGGGDSTAFAGTTSIIVGQAQTASGQYHGFAFNTFTRVKTDLGTLGGAWSAAYDVNNNGIVVGASRVAGDARLRAFQYDRGTMTALPVDLGGDSVARGVNGAGDIAGYACTAGGSCRPFLLSSGVTTLLGPANRTGVANRVNENLDVVGSLAVAGAPPRGFLYRNGALTDLGTLGGASSDARGVNEDGDVVGTAENAAGQPRAFLWRNGEMTDLNTLVPSGSGWVLESAAAISDGDQIAGYGTLNGKRRAFLLTPPTDLAAFVGGTISQHDSNLPRNGIEVGKTVEFTTSVWAPPFNWSRTIYDARMVHTLTGPAVFVSAEAHNDATCDVTPAVTTCHFEVFETDSSGREVTVRVRGTGVGAIAHHAAVSSGAADPNPDNNSIVEYNRTVAMSTFALAPAAVSSGQLATATVTLTGQAPGGDAVVRMTSSRPDIVAVQPTFIVPSWTDHRQFNIVPGVVSSPTAVEITASYGLVTITRTLTVVPQKLQQLYLTPTTVIGGCGTSQGRVVLTGVAPAGGAIVALTNTNGKATVPTRVTVPAGSDSVSFIVPTVPVITPASGVVTATFGGAAQSLNLAVRPIRAQALTLANTRVRGGTTVNGLVTLECPAMPGAIAVSVTSSNSAVAAATVPSITIPSGGTTATFSVRTTAVSSETPVTIYAWVFGVRKAVTLTVTP